MLFNGQIARLRTSLRSMLGPMLLAGTACLLAAGCQSANPKRLSLEAVEVGPLDPAPEPRDIDLDFAEAVAAYGQALVFEMHREHDKAIPYYIEVTEKDPQNRKIIQYTAAALMKQGRPEEAESLVEDKLNGSENDLYHIMLLAEIAELGKQSEKKLEWLKKARDLKPQESTTYIEIAKTLDALGRPEEALKTLSDAIDDLEDPVDLLNYLGKSQIELASEADDLNKAEVHLSSAKEYYKKALKLSPDDIPMLYQLSFLFARDNEATQAIECLERIESQQPDEIILKEQLAVSLVNALEKDEEKALTLLDAYHKENAPNPHVHYYRGVIFQTMNRLEDAEEAYKESLKLSDGNEESTYWKLGRMLLGSEPESTLAYLNDGIAKHPDSHRLTELRAYAQIKLNHYQEAADDFAKSISLQPSDAPVRQSPQMHFNYALALHHIEKVDAAGAELYKVAQYDSNYLKAYSDTIASEQNKDSSRTALKVLKYTARKMDDNTEALIMMALIHNDLEEYGEAIKIYEKIEKDNTDKEYADEVLDSRFYFWFGAACERQKEYKRAEKLFEKAIDLNPEYAQAYNYLAYMWAENGTKLDKAKTYIDQALTLSPENGAFIDTLGWIYYMQQDYEKALAEINHAAELISDDPVIYEHLGAILVKLNRDEEALPHYTHSLELNPNNEGVLRRKNEVQERINEATATIQDHESLEVPTNNLETNDPASTTLPASNSVPAEPLPTE